MSPPSLATAGLTRVSIRSLMVDPCGAPREELVIVLRYHAARPSFTTAHRT